MKQKKKLISVILYIIGLFITGLVVSVYCILIWSNFNNIQSLKKQFANVHWECEKEYDTDKKIGCDFRCEVSEKLSYGTGAHITETIDTTTGQMFVYGDFNDVVSCYTGRDLGCNIIWNYEKGCTKYILVRN